MLLIPTSSASFIFLEKTWISSNYYSNCSPYAAFLLVSLVIFPLPNLRAREYHYKYALYEFCYPHPQSQFHSPTFEIRLWSPRIVDIVIANANEQEMWSQPHSLLNFLVCPRSMLQLYALLFHYLRQSAHWLFLFLSLKFQCPMKPHSGLRLYGNASIASPRARPSSQKYEHRIPSLLCPFQRHISSVLTRTRRPSVADVIYQRCVLN